MQKFEDLDIWLLAQNLAKDLGVIFYNKKFTSYSFQDQIMRATISISNNIAEWHERNSRKEKIQFLYYAKWSVGEVRNMIYLAESFGFIDAIQKDIFLKQCTVLSVKIYYLIKSHKEL